MVYIYPGSFCPPTVGHLHIVSQASLIADKVTILCSRNDDKNNIFSMEECVEMWKSYTLPRNVDVLDFDEFRKYQTHKDELIMVRGLRNNEDAEYEKKIMIYNKDRFGITKYLFLFADSKYETVSSSMIRTFCETSQFHELHKYVSPFVISKLLQHYFNIKKIFLCVGRPASGKTSILQKYVQTHQKSGYVNSDIFNKTLRPILLQKFNEADIIKIALENDSELTRLIAKDWLRLLYQEIEKYRGCDTLFIEVAYGLQDNKKTFNYVGGRVIQFYCSESENYKRNKDRLTPELQGFINKIPDILEGRIISNQHNLKFDVVNTDINITGCIQQLNYIVKKY